LVLAREDAPGEKRLVAYVTAEPGEELDLEALRAALSRALPDYMAPAAFVALEAFPLTPNGKIDRKALPPPDIDASRTHRYVAPRNPLEATLCQIFAEVLRLERVGVEDNFFQLGGHSLLAVKLSSKILLALAVSIPLDLLFKKGTPAAIADFIELLGEIEKARPLAPSTPFATVEEFEI